MTEDKLNEVDQLIADGLAYHEAGKIEEARDHYLKALENDPQNARALDLAGLLCMQCGESDAAKEFYVSAARVEPENPRYLLHLGIVLLEQDEFEESEKVFLDVIKLDAEHADARFYLALGLRATNRREEAKEVLEIALSLDRQSSKYRKWLGLISMESGDLVSALEHTQIAVEVQDDEIDISIFSQMGEILRALDDLDLAEKSYRSGIELDDKDIKCRVGLASVLIDLGRQVDAKVELDYVIEKGGGEHAGLLSTLAFWRSIEGDEQTAREEIEAAMQLDPNGLEILLTANKVFNNINDQDKVGSILDSMQKIAPDDARVLGALLG